MRDSIRIKQRNLHKKQFIFGGAGVLIILISAYIATSFISWNNLQSRIAAHDNLDGDIARLLSEKTKSTDRVVILGQIVNSGELNCSVTPLVRWQQAFIGSLEERVLHCKGVRTRVVKAQNTSSRIVAVRADIDQLTKAVSGLKIAQKEVKEADFKALSDKVIAVKKAVDAVPVSNDMQPVKKELVVRIDTLQKLWEKLLLANKEQKRSDFEAAVNEVDQAYQKIDDVAEKTQTVYGSLLKQLR